MASKLAQKIWRKLHDYGVLVMFSHTVFSLSFALIAMLLAGQGRLQPWTIFWILVAFLGARTGANALNRVIDAEIDRKNPRTADRQIPQGRMGKREALLFALACLALMVFAASQLNWLCLVLSPVALFALVTYSYTKRFTWLCHLYLGATCAAAPLGAWLAVTGQLAVTPILFGAANTLWVAGFDIIYGAQDVAFDRAQGLHSIPARFGVKNALRIAAFFHLLVMALLLGIGLLTPEFGLIYGAGLILLAILFVLEHRLVSPDNLTQVKLASYSINQLISLVFLITGVLDALI